MTSFHETAVLVYSWPVLPLTLLWSYLWEGVMLVAMLIAFKHRQMKKTFVGSYAAVFATSVGANALCALILWILSSFIRGMDSILLTRLVLVVLVLKYCIYDKVVFVRHNLGNPKKNRMVSLLLAVFTTPWLFLVPADYAVSWLGTVLIALGAPFSRAGLPTN